MSCGNSCKNATSESGALAICASITIFPFSPRTHIAVVASDTSSPIWISSVVAFSVREPGARLAARPREHAASVRATTPSLRHYHKPTMSRVGAEPHLRHLFSSTPKRKSLWLSPRASSSDAPSTWTGAYRREVPRHRSAADERETAARQSGSNSRRRRQARNARPPPQGTPGHRTAPSNSWVSPDRSRRSDRSGSVPGRAMASNQWP